MKAQTDARMHLLRRRALRRLGWEWSEENQSWSCDNGSIETWSYHNGNIKIQDPFVLGIYRHLIQFQMWEWLLARGINLKVLPQENGSVVLWLNSHISYPAPTLSDALVAAVGGMSTYVCD